jgi:hypothetical protein
MRSGLNPRDPAFAFLGEQECRNTVCFMDAKGRLCWVPHEALKSYFARELPTHSFADWHKRLVLKEIK